MKPLLFHVKGREWRCGPSFLSSEAAFKRIQGGSTFRANGQTFTRHGTLWKAGEEMWTPGGLELLLQTLAFEVSCAIGIVKRLTDAHSGPISGEVGEFLPNITRAALIGHNGGF